jgi:bifunctional aspartokinase / homoserine dehydrogenase 1
MSQSIPSSPEERTLVMKFGGTSVGSPEAMAMAVHIVQDTQRSWPRLVVVTSALSGVTDLLLKSAAQAAQGDNKTFSEGVELLRQKHSAIAAALLPDAHLRQEIIAEIDRLAVEFSSLCQAIYVLGEATPRALDAVAAMGERMCIRLLAGCLRSGGTLAEAIEASRLVVTDDKYQSAHPDFTATTRQTRQVLQPLLDKKIVPVVTGFIGATPSGVTTTLGRGGSDYSAAILGAALPASEVWIWTDVDGVMTADPRLVPGAATIPELTYKEVSELAYFGAKVLHPKTIRPVIDAGIGLRVCNTFNPAHPGTRLVADHTSPSDGVIKAVTAIRGLQLVTVEGRGMLGVPGVAARTFGAVAATGTSVPLISQASSEQSICFAVPSEASARVIQAVEKALAYEIAENDIDRVWATGEMVIITVVGAGMRNTPGVSGRVFSVLGQNHLNVVAIAQGSSEVSISMMLDAADTKQAVNTLHSLIVTKNLSEK